MATEKIIPTILDDPEIPWHWSEIRVPDRSNKILEWCESQGWTWGIDFILVSIDRHPFYTTEWGRFKISESKTYHYLIKDEKNATMFRLTWSHNI